MALLSGKITAAERRTLLPSIERGDIHLVVGTHALVQEQVKFRALALAIIDEQHRFGVLQRGMLATKGLHPDVLVMTATPIPRTLALTECGDMEVSIIRDLPPGRKPVRTLVKPDSRREDVYDLVRHAGAGGPAGLRHLSTRGGVGEGRPQGGDGDGRTPRARCVPGPVGGAAPWAHEGRGEGARHAGVCRQAR